MTDDTHDRIPGYLGALTLAPRAARAWAAVVAVVGGADALQHACARVRTD
jgi:hypothetical protein